MGWMLPQSIGDAAPVFGETGANPFAGARLVATSLAGCTPNLAARIGDGVAFSLYRRERDWLGVLPGLTDAVASVLAARATGCIMAMRPEAFGFAPGLRDVFGKLASVRPNREVLETAAVTLGARSGGGPVLDTSDLACIEALWPLTAPTEYLLTSGGDERLLLDPQTGLNRYGCAPWPRPGVITFGSCTASSPSEGAFAAAEQARRDLIAASLATSPANAVSEASEAIAATLLRYFDVEPIAEAVLTASGTDAALVVTGFFAAEHPGATMTSILMSPSETGSGVPHAVQGRHFGSRAPSGAAVSKGEPIDGMMAGPALVAIALRDGRGCPREAADINAECEAAIRIAIASGRAVLHVIDGSKTGLTAPDRAFCRVMADRFGDKLDIVVDACQARIEPETVRWYLQHGFPVLITGSKFFAAPGFCGAVLFPRARLNGVARSARLPAGLAGYARLQGGFGSRECAGLVLRWTAALHEMARFATIPAPAMRARLHRIGQVIRGRLADDRRFKLIAAPRPPGHGWSDKRSVFTFAVWGRGGWMTQKELRALCGVLDADPMPASGDLPACQLGQPVELVGGGFAGLRLAISAGQVVESEDHAEQVGIVLKKLGLLLDRGDAAVGDPVLMQQR